MLVALGVAAPGGDYREVAGAGYARVAESGGFVTFPRAGANWGVVRAYAVVVGDEPPVWVALVAPRLVVAGQWLSLDLVAAAALASETAPATATAPPPPPIGNRPPATDGRRGGRTTLANWPRGRR